LIIGSIAGCGGGDDGGEPGDGGVATPPSCPDVAGEPVPVSDGFVSDGEYLYDADTAGEIITRRPIDGGEPEPLVSVPDLVGRLQIADGELFFVVGDGAAGRISRVSATGGSPTDVAPLDSVGSAAYAVDSRFAYVNDLDSDTGEWTLAAIPRGGGAAIDLDNGTADLVGALQMPQSFAGDGERLYWLTRGGFVRSAPSAGGGVTDLADSAIPVASNKLSGRLSLDETHVYWSIAHQAQSSYPLFRVQASGGARETIFAEQDVQALRVVSSGETVYFVDIADSSEHRIGRIASGGGEWTIVGCFEPTGNISSIAVDARGVYAPSSDGIRRFPL
jgi:hypothetical protein